MAVCNWCKKEMTDEKTTSCIKESIKFRDGKRLAQVAYDPEDKSPSMRCPDCYIAPGGLHHPGCDCETCPKCKGQLISCGCLS